LFIQRTGTRGHEKGPLAIWSKVRGGTKTDAFLPRRAQNGKTSNSKLFPADSKKKLWCTRTDLGLPQRILVPEVNERTEN